MATPQSISELVTQSPKRPILTHLNADSSWLISFPRPAIKDDEANDSPKTKNNWRSYYHVILDPWLDGEYVVTYRWIMVLQHSIKASFSTMDAVRNLILDIERAAGSTDGQDDGEVDAVFVSHYLGDHCSQASLTQINAAVPVISVDRAVQMIQSWGHFENIETMPDLSIDGPEHLWRDAPPSVLPDYVRIGRLPSGEAYPELHWATLIAFSATSPNLSLGAPDVGPETILYSPHGIYTHRLTNLDWASKYSKPLAVLHGLDPAWSPQPANLGVENAWPLVRKVSPKYWVPTHDEHLVYSGVIGWFQSKYKKRFEDVPKAEEGDGGEEGKEDGKGEKPVFRELGNGESFVLV